MFSALSGLTQALYLLFFCPFVLMFSALAANLIEHHNILTSSLSAPLNGAVTIVLRTSLLTGTPLYPPGRAVALRACGQAHYSESRTVRP